MFTPIRAGTSRFLQMWSRLQKAQRPETQLLLQLQRLEAKASFQEKAVIDDVRLEVDLTSSWPECDDLPSHSDGPGVPPRPRLDELRPRYSATVGSGGEELQLVDRRDIKTEASKPRKQK